METVFNNFVWSACYLVVLIGLSAYGIHRWSIIYLFLKHIGRESRPKGEFADLPTVTVQLPIFNEATVTARLIEATGQLDYPADKLEIQVLDDSTDETAGLAGEAASRALPHPTDVAEDLKRHGGVVPGVEPGEPTAEHLDSVLSPITLMGAVYFVVICLIPDLFSSFMYSSVSNVMCALILYSYVIDLL